MDSIAQQSLRRSIKDVREIRLECLKENADINLIHERVICLYINLCVIFEDFYASLVSASPHLRNIERKEDWFGTLEAMHERFDSLGGPERDALLEQARQTLPPRSQNDADAVHIAALEILAAGRKGHHK